MATTSTITYNDGSGNVYVFTIPTSPVALNPQAGSNWSLENTPFTLNGTPYTSDFLYFYATAQGGGFELHAVTPPLDVDPTGDQMYSGSESAPTMLSGTLAISPGTLSISQNSSPSSIPVSVQTGTRFVTRVKTPKSAEVVSQKIRTEIR